MLRLSDLIRQLLAACKMFIITLKGGDKTMVAVYVALITYQVYTIDNVPKQLKDAVTAALAALGLDGTGNPAA